MHEFENQEVEGVGFAQGKGFQVSKNNRKTSKAWWVAVAVFFVVERVVIELIRILVEKT